MKKLESENNLVVRANQLIEAKYRLTATEQKIIYILTSMVDKNDEDFKPYLLRIEELTKLIKTDSHSKYSEIKAVCRNLMKKVFTIHDTVKKEEIMVNWFSSVNYKYGQGLVEFEFSPYLKPFMLQLKSSFTKFKLIDLMQLRSGYSLRLYELLKQYEKIGKRQFDITKLRELIGIQKHEYAQQTDFKKRVLLQAQKEINLKADIMFEFEEIKEGKRVTSIKFTVFSKSKAIVIESEPDNNQSVSPAEPTQNDIQTIKEEFQRRYKRELADKFVREMMQKKGLAHVQECLRTYPDYIRGQKNITNIGGHFRKFVMEGYEKPVAYNGNVSPTAYPEFCTATKKEAEDLYTKEKRVPSETAVTAINSMFEMLGIHRRKTSTNNEKENFGAVKK